MKLIVLGHLSDVDFRSCEEFVHSFSQRYTGISILKQDVNSKEGALIAQTYQVTSYPAFLAISEDGSLRQFWQGDTIPLIDEVAAYLIESS
jgi:hypothetical protein